MAEKNNRRNKTTDALFDAILSLETREECYNFFEDLCTVKEISDMAQRLEAAKLLLGGSTYDQIVKAVEISTATISRINRCIQYGSGGRGEPAVKWCRGWHRERQAHRMGCAQVRNFRPERMTPLWQIPRIAPAPSIVPRCPASRWIRR